MALSWLSLLLSAVMGTVAGVLIGCIGVGGVVIVPLLLLRPDIDVHLAVMSCMTAYILAGLAGAVAYIRKGLVPWRIAIVMCIPAAPAALLGSWTLINLSGHTVKVIFYSVMLVTSCLSALRSVHAVWKEKRLAKDGNGSADAKTADAASCSEDEGVEENRVQEEVTGPGSEEEQLIPTEQTTAKGEQQKETSQEHGAEGVAEGGENFCFGSMTVVQLLQALFVGTVTGFGSSLTGTSGPVLLLPLLFILLWPALPALGCAQLIQVPIACAATIGNVLFTTSSDVDLTDMFKLAGCSAAGLVPFVFVGAAIANHVPQKALKIVVAVLLVAASLALLLKEVI